MSPKIWVYFLSFIAASGAQVFAGSTAPPREFFKNLGMRLPSVCNAEITRVLKGLNRDDPIRLARHGHSDWDSSDFAEIVGAIASTVDQMAFFVATNPNLRSILEGEDFLALALIGIHKESKDPQHSWQDILKMSRIIAKRRILDEIKVKSLRLGIKNPYSRKIETPTYLSQFENLDHSLALFDLKAELELKEIEITDFFETLTRYLKPDEKQLIVLLYSEGLPAAEIAKKMDVKPARVIYLKDRILAKIRFQFPNFRLF